MFFLLRWIKNIHLDGIFKKAEKAIHEFIPKAIEIVNNIKKFDDTHPEFADILTAIIPGTWDDALKEKARVVIPRILVQMQVISTDQSGESLDDFIKLTVEKILSLDKQSRGYKWFELASRIAVDFANGELSDAEVKSILQAIYENLKEDSSN